MKRSYVIIVLALCLVASLVGNWWQYNRKPDKVEVVTKVEIVEKKDTAPSLKEEKPVAVVSVPVKKVSDNGENISEDSTEISDEGLEVVGDSVKIPITQKVYEDSLYTAYVSGYMQSLDSITIRERLVTTTIKETYTEREFRRWNVGITGGYGYGIREKQLDFFVGVGVTFNLFPEKKKKKSLLQR